MHIGHELEAFLRRLEPGCDDQWAGASEREITALEIYAKLTIPPFYRWFLLRMGQSMGPLAVPGRDMTVATLLLMYEQGFTPPDPKLLLIGVEADEIMPMHLYCDLRKPMRDDALVCSDAPRGGFRQNEFETLGDMLAWSAFIRHRLPRCARLCAGTFRTSGRDILAELEPALRALGFTKLLPGGAFMGLYERSDVALQCMVPPLDADCNYIFFELGADSEETIRSTLGAVVVETPVQVEVRKWTPSLTG